MERQPFPQMVLGQLDFHGQNKTKINMLTLNVILYSKFNSQWIIEFSGKYIKLFGKAKNTERKKAGENSGSKARQRLNTKTMIHKRKK